MADEDLLVILSPSGNHCSHDGGSDAAADVTHEVDHAGDTIAFVRRNSVVTRCGDGNKQKSDSYHLCYAQPHRKTEADEQIDFVSAIEESDSKAYPSRRDQPSGLNV